MRREGPGKERREAGPEEEKSEERKLEKRITGRGGKQRI